MKPFSSATEWHDQVKRAVLGWRRVAPCRGCLSQGSSREETIANIKEAIEGYIDVLREDNLPVPEERFQALLLAV